MRNAESLVLGIDFGTDSARSVVVRTANGDVVSSSVILKETPIPYSSYAIPISPYYGYRSVVRVRP